MPKDVYSGVVAKMQGPATAVSNTLSETSILTGAAKWIMPGGWCDALDRVFRLTAIGRISTVVTTPGTLTFKLKAGSTAIGTSQAFPLNVVAKTNVTWELGLLIDLRAIDTIASVMVNGTWVTEAILASPAASAGGVSVEPWQTSAPAVGTTFDATVANIIDLTATWSVQSASNSIRAESYILESLI